MAFRSRPDSFAEVMLPHLDAAYNLARWLMRNSQDAEDVVQEAMLRALTYYSGFNGTNARAWLLQIVRNAAYASHKLNRGAATMPLDPQDGERAVPPQLIDAGDDPEMTLMRKRDRQEIHRLLGELPIELRETVVLRELEELSYKEISHITDAPIGTVMSRLWRGRRLLEAAVSAKEAKP